MQTGLVLWLLCQSLLYTATGTTNIRVNFTPESESGGTVHIALYVDEATFKAGDPALRKQTVSLTGTTPHEIVFRDVPVGEYAIAAYQDVDDNGKLDTNMFGIPTEPYAFSNNVRAKWRAPRFAEARFSITTAEAVTQQLTLLRWGKR